MRLSVIVTVETGQRDKRPASVMIAVPCFASPVGGVFNFVMQTPLSTCRLKLTAQDCLLNTLPLPTWRPYLELRSGMTGNSERRKGDFSA